MANVDVGNVFGVQDKRLFRGTTSAEAMTEKANMFGINEMRARLAALNAGYYTAARLDVMLENDMIFALKDAGSW